MHGVKLDARLNLFITLVAVFMTCLVVGDLIGGKLTSFYLFGHEWVFSAGQIAFPITFILTDIINEFYGRTVVRRVTFLAFFMVGLTFCIIYISAQLPWASFAQDAKWEDAGGVTPKMFGIVFTQATRIQMASMVAFLISNLVDIWVFFLLKKLTREKHLWLRSTGSTAVSQLIDTIVISALIWIGKVGFERYVTIVITSYVVKLAAAIVVTPLIYALHDLLEKRFDLHPAPPEVASADLDPPDPPAPGATAG